MKTKQLILLALFALLCSEGFAQDTTRRQSAEIKIGSPAPYFVLQMGEKSVGIDTKEDTNVDIKSINPDGIKEVNVLKDASARSLYGDKGINGVVIIVFKDSYILPKNLQAKFDEVK